MGDVVGVALHRDLGAGRLPDGPVEPDLVVVATPPDVTARCVASALERFPRAAVTDVASVKGAVLDAYDKRHLVPFGEYLPFQDFLESLGFMHMTGVRGGFSEGAGSLLLNVPGAPQARPLICYEIIFPDEIASRTERPGWLLNLTNDAWFGATSAPYQHFEQASMRAIEEGRYLVRSANTGVSGIVDPYGRVLERTDIFQAAVLVGEARFLRTSTYYSRHGDLIAYASTVVTALLLLIAVGNRFRR